MTTDTQQPPEAIPTRQEGGLPGGSREALAAERVALVWASISALAVAAYLTLYLVTGAWQMLGPLGMGMLAAVTCLTARALARRQQVDLALVVLLSTAAGVLPLTSLFLSGVVALYSVVTVLA